MTVLHEFVSNLLNHWNLSCNGTLHTPLPYHTPLPQRRYYCVSVENVSSTKENEDKV